MGLALHLLILAAALPGSALLAQPIADPSARPAPVTAMVEYKELIRVTAAEGIVEAVRQSTLAAQVSGRVVALGVKAGDTVKAGQTLFVMGLDAVVDGVPDDRPAEDGRRGRHRGNRHHDGDPPPAADGVAPEPRQAGAALRRQGPRLRTAP